MSDEMTETRTPNNEDLDPRVRVASLEESFLTNLKEQGKKSSQAAKDIEAAPASEPASDAGRLFSGPHKEVAENTEELLTSLYEVRDNLISTFEGSKLNKVLADSITRNIHSLGSCITRLGGQVNKFDPLEHVSRLKTPDLQKNADRVIETTKQCYLGSIEGIETKEDDVNTILATFVGREGSVQYKAAATITAAHGWVGNEAIDYVYTPGEGRLSVKAFSAGKWIDKSDDYSIYWDLEEGTEVEEGSEGLQKKEAGKTENKKEGVERELENNVSCRNNDFPIEENTEKS